MKLLVAEDETDLLKALNAILTHSGYTVDCAQDGREALDYALVGGYDGIILDIMMPGLDGFQVLSTLRKSGITSPVLFLTARSGVEDRIAGLDLGADDYLAKPFDTGELLARIRAMTRRRPDYTPGNLSLGNLVLDRAGFTLSCGNAEPVRLSSREFQMMEMLMESPGRVISSELFMDRIWAGSDAGNDVVFVYVSNLRKKLRSLRADVGIRSARGLGYSIAPLDDSKG